MANSKKKGNRFERVVAKYFTDWSGFKFGRTPGSGSFHNNRDLGSDLICNDDKHKNRCCISIECKNYQDIRFEHVLLGNKRLPGMREKKSKGRFCLALTICTCRLHCLV